VVNNPQTAAPAPRPEILSKKQTSREAIVARQRAHAAGRRQLQSGQPFTCVSESTKAVPQGFQGAVFSLITTLDSGGSMSVYQFRGKAHTFHLPFISHPSTDNGACARSCRATHGCTFSYIYDSYCYVRGSTKISGMDSATVEDQFFFIDRTCADTKATIRMCPSVLARLRWLRTADAWGHTCCNLYY
jgi:hypothetical protein